MPKTLQLRRGTTAQITANTPASGELFVDTDKKTVTVGDGSTAGGVILARDDRVSDVYNRANAVNGFAVSAFNTANGANGLAQSAFNSANTNTTNITAVNGFAQGAYNTANGANGLASGAFNAANNKQDLLVSGTNIKTINGSSVLGAGNLVVSGGGGGSANTVAVTPTSDNFITIGNPTNVEYFPASNLTFSGPLVLAANLGTTSLQSSSNNYIDVVPYEYSQSVDELTGSKYGFFALCFNRRNVGSFPARWVQEIDNLIPGDRITLKFVAGANNNVMDTFTVPLNVIAPPAIMASQAATEWTRFAGSPFGYNSDFTPTQTGDKPENSGTGFNWNFSSSTKALSGKTIFFRADVVQPAYTSNTTLITTQLIGENTGRPIHHNFLTRISGRGYLNPTSIFTNSTTSFAVSPTNGTNQRVGVYRILIEKQAGTVVTLSSNDYREILVSNSAVAWGNTVSSVTSPAKVYDSANSKVWISGANLIGTVTTTTPLQVYNPPVPAALIDVGPNLKVYGDPVNNRLVSTGKISKAEDFKILGTVSSQSTVANTVYYPTVVSTRYMGSANTGSFTPYRSINGVYLDNGIGGGGAETIKLINVTPEVYELIGQNNSIFYIHYGTVSSGGQTANLTMRTTNQGNNGIYISSYSGQGSSWTEGNWIGANLGTYWQDGTFYTSNSSYSKPTWTYDLDTYNNQIAIPTNVVTLTTNANVINELITLRNFSAGPGISPLGNANNFVKIYVDGILTNVNGIDAANNRIITNLPASKFANTDFTGATITVFSSLNDYATLSDVAKSIPAWVNAISTSSNQTSTSHYVGGGAGGVALRQWSINEIIAGSSQRTTNMSFGYFSQQGAVNFGQGIDRAISYNQQLGDPGSDKLATTSPENTALLTFNLGVAGGLATNYFYANTIMGTNGISYANTYTGDRVYSSETIRVGARNISNPDSANSSIAVLFRANNITLRNDSPNVTDANSSLVITTGTVRGNERYVPPGAPSEARSFRLGADPFSGGSGGGGFYIKNQSWDLANTACSWTVESWICSSYLYQAVPLITALGTGNLTDQGTTYMRGEFPFYGVVNINSNQQFVVINQAIYNSLGRIWDGNQQTGGYNNYFPLAGKWYHMAFVHDLNDPLGSRSLTMYLNGFIYWRVTNPGFGASSLNNVDWGVYAAQAAWYYNYRVSFGQGNNTGVRYTLPTTGPLFDGSTPIRAFTPELAPYGVTPQRTITGDTQYRYDALDLSGGIRMDNTANTYVSGAFKPPPPTNPIGGYLFVEEGALKYRGSSGTITTIANP